MSSTLTLSFSHPGKAEAQRAAKVAATAARVASDAQAAAAAAATSAAERAVRVAAAAVAKAQVAKVTALALPRPLEIHCSRAPYCQGVWMLALDFTKTVFGHVDNGADYDVLGYYAAQAFAAAALKRQEDNSGRVMPREGQPYIFQLPGKDPVYKPGSECWIICWGFMMHGGK